MKPPRVSWLVALVPLSLVVGTPAFLAHPADAAENLAVRADSEAWYSIAPTCQLPTGCSPAGPLPPPRSYPDKTLHVGLTLGQEDSRTFLTLDTSALPVEADLSGAQLLLPVAGPESGTDNAPAAKLRACLVKEKVTPASGQLASGPAFDCRVTAPGAFTPGPAPVFLVDLAPFLPAWSSGSPASLAIVPASPDAGSASSWHVAFSRRDATAAGARPITATFAFTRRPAPSATAQPQATAPPPPPGPTATTGQPQNAPPASEPPATAAPSRTAPPASRPPPTTVQSQRPAGPPPSGPATTAVAAPLPASGASSPTTPRASATPPRGPVSAPRALPSGRRAGYAYPVVFLMPLMLLCLGGYLARALTSEVRLAGG